MTKLPPRQLRAWMEWLLLQGTGGGSSPSSAGRQPVPSAAVGGVRLVPVVSVLA